MEVCLVIAQEGTKILHTLILPLDDFTANLAPSPFHNVCPARISDAKLQLLFQCLSGVSVTKPALM